MTPCIFCGSYSVYEDRDTGLSYCGDCHAEPAVRLCTAYATGKLKKKGGAWIQCSNIATNSGDTFLCTLHANRLNRGHAIHGTDNGEGYRMQRMEKP